jgi:transcriptional regulator with XRE-family HTH domain
MIAAMQLREYIAQRRKEIGLSQNDIATALGYTDTAISKIESGASFPPISILPSLANALQLDLNDLLTTAEKPGPFTNPNPPYDWKTVSLNLRALRLAHHLRQREAAAALGVNKRTLVTYEKGDACPSFAALEKILPLLPGKPVDFFYGTLFPEIQASPSFHKRGPSPFFLFLIGFVLGCGLLGAILGPIVALSSQKSTGSGPFQGSFSATDGEIPTSNPSAVIPYLDELTVIAPGGLSRDAAMKPNSSLQIGVYTGNNYSEQMRRKTTFVFTLETTLTNITMTADSACYPCQIVTVGDFDLSVPSLERSFRIGVKAYQNDKPSAVVIGNWLDIVINDTGTLTD